MIRCRSCPVNGVTRLLKIVPFIIPSTSQKNAIKRRMKILRRTRYTSIKLIKIMKLLYAKAAVLSVINVQASATE